jgi:hypothetical protein
MHNKAYKLRRVAPPGFATFCFRKAPAKRLIGSAVGAPRQARTLLIE